MEDEKKKRKYTRKLHEWVAQKVHEKGFDQFEAASDIISSLGSSSVEEEQVPEEE